MKILCLIDLNVESNAPEHVYCKFWHNLLPKGWSALACTCKPKAHQYKLFFQLLCFQKFHYLGGYIHIFISRHLCTDLTAQPALEKPCTLLKNQMLHPKP